MRLSISYRNAHAIHSLFVVATRQYFMLHIDARYCVKSHWVGGRGIAGEFVTVTLEEMDGRERGRKVEHFR